MSPREMIKSVGTGAGNFMDLKDADTKQFAYGKVWPIMVIVCIIGFHAIGNPFDLGTAILLSATAVGPWAFIKFLERTSVSITHSRTEAARGAVISEQTTQKTGAVAPVAVPDASPARDPDLEYEPTP